MNTRRRFLMALVGAGSMMLMQLGRLAAQVRGTTPPPIPGSKEKDEELPPAKPATKAILEANEKDIKKNVEKLYQLASELKAEVEKTDSTNVLSLAMLKKAEEIEKLAKDIKTRAKG